MAGDKPIFVPILKIDDSLRVVKGPVLRPEVRDRQNSIISASVIRQAAHDFVIRLSSDDEAKRTKAGFMHNDFTKELWIVESWVLEYDWEVEIDPRVNPDIAKAESGGAGDLAKVVYPAGTWWMAMKIMDDKIWQGVPTIYKGFSIGGRGTVLYGNE